MINFDRRTLVPLAVLILVLASSPAALAKSQKIGVSGAKIATKLSISTQSPSNGQTVSGPVTWSVATTGESPSRVDFVIDGTRKWSQTTAPFLFGGVSGGLDTKSLSNGSHTLVATAYGARGLKASSTVTVNVKNAAPAPSPAPEPERAPEEEKAPTPPAGAAPLYWGATIGSHLTGNQAPWDMSAVGKFEEGPARVSPWSSFSSPSPTAAAPRAASTASRRPRWKTSAPTARSRSELELAVDPIERHGARLPALRRDRRSLRLLHCELRRRGGPGATRSSSASTGR